MTTYNQARQLLRRTALSAAMLLVAAPAALADPPGYLFQDFDGTAPATVSAPIPPQRNAANQEAARLASTRAFADVTQGSSRMAQEHHACAVVLGLDPSEHPHDTCIRSLDRTLSESDQAR
jgi:hypothetical protein